MAVRLGWQEYIMQQLQTRQCTALAYEPACPRRYGYRTMALVSSRELSPPSAIGISANDTSVFGTLSLNTNITSAACLPTWCRYARTSCRTARYAPPRVQQSATYMTSIDAIARSRSRQTLETAVPAHRVPRCILQARRVVIGVQDDMTAELLG